MEANSTTRTEFLQRARRALEMLGVETPDLAALLSHEGPEVSIKFSADNVEFALHHSTAPAIDALMLIECVLGPIPAADMQEAPRRLLELNHDFSSLLLTGFALDPGERAVFTHSCALKDWNAEALVLLMDGMTALAARWREDGFYSVADVRSLLATEDGAIAVHP